MMFLPDCVPLFPSPFTAQGCNRKAALTIIYCAVVRVSMTSANEVPTLPSINLLFAEVLQRQIEQPASPPIRRPSAWPGFVRPCLLRVVSTTILSAHGSPVPTKTPWGFVTRLQTRRLPSKLDAELRPQLFLNPSTAHPYFLRSMLGRVAHPSLPLQMVRVLFMGSTRNLYDLASYSPYLPALDFSNRPQKRESWSDSVVPLAGDYDSNSGRLVPISMTTTGSPRLYNRDGPRSAPLPSHRVVSCHCEMDRLIEQHRAVQGDSHVESPYAHKQQIPTPLPPAHGHIMIAFQPTPATYPGRSFGVCMADILDFRACLLDPDTPVLEGETEEIYLTLEAKGYSTFMQKISGNCAHRRISRFNLAYRVASEYDTFLKACV
ncbi:hypothetical protein MIND_00218900 [Mycena indigotica]|uniref:Uncharacterized protein n=1 Tax=Mycena indigotica TaxID=2126181 RepID=A0A8H6T828_9AGAR|nr:uncharacterized protein MIND_00218900 [Mycena indigotica]KAF7312067.1 hypothetical protein MIND_00218900 [Mycena indigotica]